MTDTIIIPPSTQTYPGTAQLRFVGFENLTLGSRTFSNVCKTREVITIDTPASEPSSRTSINWYAKDYGLVRSDMQDANGVFHRIELVNVLTAP